ncbi:MAG: hypothetical protein AAF628_25390 [Planctomycetota bacterium]
MTPRRPFQAPGAPPPTPAEAADFVRRFEAGTLSLDDWNHRAHCLVGLVLLLRSPGADVLPELRTAIGQFNERSGVANTDDSGDHETLTRTYADGLAAFVRRHAATDLSQELLVALWADPVSTMEYARQRYSPDRSPHG